MFLKRVCHSLKQYQVDYALVGGYALALHGAVRATVDIDLVLRITKKEFQKAQQALEAIGLQSRLPVNAEQVYDFREEYVKNRNLIAWSFFSPDNSTEIVDIIIMADLKNKKTVLKTIGDFKVKVLGIEDLIKMKQQSAREQDLEDIKALEKLK